MKLFVPKWKDDKGNIAIFPYINGVFKTEEEALDFQSEKTYDMFLLLFAPFGILEHEGEFEKGMDIANLPFKKGMFSGVFIAGPLFDEKVAEDADD